MVHPLLLMREQDLEIKQMGHVLQLPRREKTQRYGDRLQTQGNQWTTQEKKLVDRAEFLEAMILVLDDVRMQNIRSRDYAMMEIVSEEIPLYQQRLEEVKRSLLKLRQDYNDQSRQVAN